MNEKTSFETNPVESPADALRAFVEAYDVLQSTLAELNDAENAAFADTLRGAMYRPVLPEGGFSPPISLYEIGVVYLPNEPGKYGVNSRKLNKALITRQADVRAMFVQEDGILPHLCEILSGFLYPPESADFSGNEIVGNSDYLSGDFSHQPEINEYVYAAALRFLNECRRLTAMWA